MYTMYKSIYEQVTGTPPWPLIAGGGEKHPLSTLALQCKQQTKAFVVQLVQPVHELPNTGERH